MIIVLTFTLVPLLGKYLYFLQSYDNHFVKALSPKYPEIASSSLYEPVLLDPNLKAKVVYKGLRYPTGLAFIGPDDILVTEKDTGTVQRILNGNKMQQPLINANVATYAHRGMLGIATNNPNSTNTTSSFLDSKSEDKYDNIAFVFLYYSQAQSHTSDDISEGKQPLGNLLYRYELINNKLVHPKLLLNLPAIPGAIGNGGKMIIGPDKNVYLSIGEVGINGHNTKAQNILNGSKPDGTSGILRINQNGQPILPGILGNEFPLNLYYSYGIWNSFGLAFDPISGTLWDTQIGLPFGDEINRVDPGFNSGYKKIDGIWLHGNNTDRIEKHVASDYPNNLVDFDGRGKYHLPQFTWFHKVVPTGITFLNSINIGNSYRNDMFVADAKNGNIYHFKLNEKRTDIIIPKLGPLSDKVVDSTDTLDQIMFGKDFGAITDLKTNPYDGNLYVLTFDEIRGTIYKIERVDK